MENNKIELIIFLGEFLSLPIILIYFLFGAVVIIGVTIVNVVYKVMHINSSLGGTQEDYIDVRISLETIFLILFLIVMIFGRNHFIWYQDFLLSYLYIIAIFINVQLLFKRKFYRTRIIVTLGFYFSSQYIIAVVFALAILVLFAMDMRIKYKNKKLRI